MEGRELRASPRSAQAARTRLLNRMRRPPRHPPTLRKLRPMRPGIAVHRSAGHWTAGFTPRHRFFSSPRARFSRKSHASLTLKSSVPPMNSFPPIPSGMTRRHLLRQVFAYSAAAALAGRLPAFSAPAPERGRTELSHARRLRELEEIQHRQGRRRAQRQRRRSQCPEHAGFRWPPPCRVM